MKVSPVRPPVVGVGRSRESYVLHILTNPIYTGMLRSNGELFEGKHEAIIPPSLFDACQLVLGRRGKSNVPKHKPFLYRNMFVCGECGGTVTVEVQKGHTYLRCTKRNGPCGQPYLREEDATRQVKKILSNFIVPQQIVDHMLEQLEAKRRQDQFAWKAEAKEMKDRIAGFDVKLQRLTDVYVDGSLALQEYNHTKAKLLKQKAHCAENLAKLETSHKSSIEPTISFIRGLTGARIVAQGDGKTKQRDFLQKPARTCACEAVGCCGKRAVPGNSLCRLRSFARRHPDAPTPSASPDDASSRLCPSPYQGRMSLDVFHAFFQGDPAWQ